MKPNPVPAWLERSGYGGLVLLAFVLPFDLANHPMAQAFLLTVTNLTVVVWLVTALAIATLVVTVNAHLHGTTGAGEFSASLWRRQRLAVAFLLVLLATSGLTSLAAHRLVSTLPWALNLLAGGVICLAVPLWLSTSTGSRVQTVIRAFIAGAVVTACVGLLEVAIGSHLDHWLLWFRPQATTMGPYLRLTSTLHYANEAAMYFCLALPFALAGLIHAMGSRARRLVIAGWLAAVDLLVVALLLTYSRGGLLALLASLLAMGIAGRGRWHWRAAVRSAPALAVAAGLLLPVFMVAASTSSIDALRATTQNDVTWYRARYVSEIPATLAAGRLHQVLVTVHNLSPLVWKASGPHDYGLSYHWLYRSWRVAQLDAPITWLTGAVPSGGDRTLATTIRAPLRPGRYLLVWDMLWHQTTWFGLKTASFQTYPVHVIALTGGKSGRVGVQAVPSAGQQVTRLPMSQTADRPQIWDTALKLIERHPLLGTGFHGFRRHYQDVVTPSPHAPISPPANAHNLVLELTTDWGLVGTLAFFVLMAALWWPLLDRACRGRVTLPWHLAVVGAGAAFLGQGMVEYFLGTPTILFAFWLLCGLALSAGSSYLVPRARLA